MRLRVPVIPGLTDDEDNLRAIAAFAGELAALAGQADALPIDLLAYHRLTESVYRVFGMPYSLLGLAPPSPERMAQLRTIVDAAARAVSS
jgi:pyruvate formate lyase activating enzyme